MAEKLKLNKKQLDLIYNALWEMIQNDKQLLASRKYNPAAKLSIVTRINEAQVLQQTINDIQGVLFD